MNFNFDILEILVIGIALLYSIISHELGHGYVAYLMGDNTAKEQGRLSLNPIRHIDPIGLLSMIIFKFGWAKAVPININNFKYKRLGLFLVSIAGICVNLLSALIAAILLLAFYDPFNYSYINIFLEYVILYGVILASFNIMPIPPLDGSKIIVSFLPEKLSKIILQIEKYGMIILMILLVTDILDGPIIYVRELFLDAIFNIAFMLVG